MFKPEPILTNSTGDEPELSGARPLCEDCGSILTPEKREIYINGVRASGWYCPACGYLTILPEPVKGDVIVLRSVMFGGAHKIDQTLIVGGDEGQPV